MPPEAPPWRLRRLHCRQPRRPGVRRAAARAPGLACRSPSAPLLRSCAAPPRRLRRFRYPRRGPRPPAGASQPQHPPAPRRRARSGPRLSRARRPCGAPCRSPPGTASRVAPEVSSLVSSQPAAAVFPPISRSASALASRISSQIASEPLRADLLGWLPLARPPRGCCLVSHSPPPSAGGQSSGRCHRRRCCCEAPTPPLTPPCCRPLPAVAVTAPARSFRGGGVLAAPPLSPGAPPPHPSPLVPPPRAGTGRTGEQVRGEES